MPLQDMQTNLSYKPETAGSTSTKEIAQTDRIVVSTTRTQSIQEEKGKVSVPIAQRVLRPQRPIGCGLSTATAGKVLEDG